MSVAGAEAGLGGLGAGWKHAGRSRRKHFTFNSTSKITDKPNVFADGQRCSQAVRVELPKQAPPFWAGSSAT